jgi:hypothetical protein
VAALATILKWALLAPILIAVVLLAVANGQSVSVHLNPFAPDDQLLTYELRLYQLVFLVFVVGVLIGGFVVWLGQGRHRRAARTRSGRRPSAETSGEAWIEGRSAPVRPPAGGYLPPA